MQILRRMPRLQRHDTPQEHQHAFHPLRDTHPDLVYAIEAAQVRAVGVVQVEHLPQEATSVTTTGQHRTPTPVKPATQCYNTRPPAPRTAPRPSAAAPLLHERVKSPSNLTFSVMGLNVSVLVTS